MKGLFLGTMFLFSSLALSESSDQLSALQKQIIKSVLASKSAGNDAIAIDFLKGKFFVPENGQPIFYPSPYPFLPSSARPRITLNKGISGSTPILAPQRATLKRRSALSTAESADSCSVFLNPPALFPAFSGFPIEDPSLDCIASAYRQILQVDETGLSSLQSNTLEGMAQAAYLSIPDLSSMSEADQARFFSEGAAPSVALRPVPASFLEYVYYSPEDTEYSYLSQAVKGIKVQVGSTLVPLLPLAPPPAPRCELALLTSGPIREGMNVEFGVRVNSVTRSAIFSAEGLPQDILLPDSELALSTVGPMAEIGKIRFQVPTLDDATPSEDGTYVLWPVEIDVRGVDSSLDVESCGLNVRVEKIPKPLCALSADNPSISLNQTAQLTLDCNQEGSGPVTSASINNANATLNGKVARASYKRTAVGDIEISAKAVGPGGEFVTSLVLAEGPGCPADDPKYLWVVRRGSAVWYFGRAPRRTPDRAYTLEKAHVKGWGKCPANSYCMDYHTGTIGHRRWSFLQVGPRYSPTCSIQRALLRTVGCFAKDTRIQMASGHEKLVSEIQAGEWVYNPHYQGPVQIKKVVKGPEKKSLYEIQVKNKKLEVTEDHPFLTQRGWVQARELKKSDRLLGEGHGKELKSIRKLTYRGPQNVWNFEVESEDPMAHVVFANGLPTGDLKAQEKLKKTNAKALP